MFKDKNGEPLETGDDVTYYGTVYKITRFMTLMKGVQACGEHGCFDVKEVEKVVKEEKKDEENLGT